MPRSPGTFWAYALLQIPDTLLAIAVLAVLHQWAGLPAAWAAALLGLWTLKNLLGYVLLRDALVPSRLTGLEALRGRSGAVVEALNPRGRIRVNGELWWAETALEGGEVPVGARVIVRGCRGLTLLVEPEAPAPPPG
jgi:membrane protein implicated in regulation of membrane protease activity